MVIFLFSYSMDLQAVLGPTLPCRSCIHPMNSFNKYYGGPGIFHMLGTAINRIDTNLHPCGVNFTGNYIATSLLFPTNPHKTNLSFCWNPPRLRKSPAEIDIMFHNHTSSFLNFISIFELFIMDDFKFQTYMKVVIIG